MEFLLRMEGWVFLFLHKNFKIYSNLISETAKCGSRFFYYIKSPGTTLDGKIKRSKKTNMAI